LQEVTGSLDESLLAERLSKEAASSRWHFERAFRSVTGETFAQVVKRLRLERAAFRLKEGMPVLETALDAGYESAEAFARAFKRAFGLTPSRVASLPWWKGELPSPNGLHWRPNASPRWQLSGQRPADGRTRIVTLPSMPSSSGNGRTTIGSVPRCGKRYNLALPEPS
jgi:AraC-like DNA-binding protein